MAAILTAILVTLLILCNPSLNNGANNIQSTSSKIKYVTKQYSEKKVTYTLQSFNGVTYFIPDYFKVDLNQSKQEQGYTTSVIDYEINPYIGVSVTVATIPISSFDNITLKQYLKDFRKLSVRTGRFFTKDGNDWFESSEITKDGEKNTKFITIQNKKAYYFDYGGRTKEYEQYKDVFEKFIDSVTFSNLTS